MVTADDFDDFDDLDNDIFDDDPPRIGPLGKRFHLRFRHPGRRR